MLYSLWDIETNNLIAEYATQREALAVVLRGIAEHGPRDADSLSLDVEDEQGNVTTIAYGAALADIARKEFAASRLAG
jgi:hypothetical protein